MKRDFAVLIALALLLIFIAFAAPSFFSPANLRDILLANLAVLIVAIGMTLVIVLGQIDISIGAQFAVCSVLAGLLAKAGCPAWLLMLLLLAAGTALGSLNGLLVANFRLPSIVVTLAAMAVLRDSLRWATGGKWVQDLPASFQWFGFSQRGGQWLLALMTAAIVASCAYAARHLAAGRMIFATGSDAESARLAGIPTVRVVFCVFAFMGALTALAALLNAVRFPEVPGNSGAGLELKAIAAVVVGGTSITGGRGSLAGSMLGVALLAVIGPMLTFLGVNAYWEQAIQGAIILVAVGGTMSSRKRA